jgi:Flp pilus assembly protein TadG
MSGPVHGMRPRAARVLADRRGATIADFAVVLPVMLVVILGLSDLTYQAYVQAVLTGAMQKAGRDSSLQDNSTTTAGATIDQQVMNQVWSVAKGATWQSSRKSYAQYGYITPEPYEDINNNGVYDPTVDCFTDLNGNRSRDLDPGLTGQGGANDVVVYTMTIRYTRLSPIGSIIGWSQTPTATATTILKNQPYATQTSAVATRVCP